jgi:hypothetical protein
MATLKSLQPSFGAGELSPFLYGRVDLAKFHVGARTMENFFVHPHGGASNRAGTRFVGEVDNSAIRHRLIPFQFRTLPAGQTYALVFGDKTMQVVYFNNGQPGFVQDAPGHTYTLATPYAAADLPLLKYVQSADTMTLTHASYPPMRLTRTGHASWTITPITFAPLTPAPTNVSVTSGGGSAYLVTAISDSTGEESLQIAAVGGASAIAWTPVVGCTNYNIYKGVGSIYGFIAQVQTSSFTDAGLAPDVGNTAPQQRNPFSNNAITGLTIVNGGSGYTSSTIMASDQTGSGATFTLGVTGGVITSATVNTPGKNYSQSTSINVREGGGSGATVTPIYTYGYTNYDGIDWYYVSGLTVTAGGSGYGSHPTVHLIDTQYGVTDPVGVTFTVSGGVISGVASFTPTGSTAYAPNNGIVGLATILDSGGMGAVLTPVLTSSSSTNPQCSAYYLQRQGFAGTLAQPQTLWFSDVGAFNNMAVSSPTKDSDAITRTLVGQQVNEIRHLVPAGNNPMLMTSGAEWRCYPGPSANALTPAACFTLPQTAHGSSHVPPIWTQNSLLFVKEKGSRVIELRYDALQDLYQSFDMSVLASHLLYDTTAQYQVQEWAYAAEPFQIVWAVRSDGVLLGFTFMREHEVYAWHRHITDGAVESVCSITEPDGSGGFFDAVYLIVKRTIGGVARRYVERMVPRLFATVADAWFVDCALQYSGPPVTVVSGLGHLEGKTVAILGDGSVVPSQVVTGGTVTLDAAYSKVTVGLPYTARLETLNLEVQGAPTLQGEMKKIAQVTVRVKDARGLQLGLDQGSLQEVKQRTSETLGTAIQPFEGDWQVSVPSEWNRNGRIVAQQTYLLPATILDLIAEVNVGD